MAKLKKLLADKTIIFPAVFWGMQFLLALGIVYLSTRHVGLGPHLAASPLIDNWFQGFGVWDGGWYLSIAKNGYTSFESTAFFPFYPLMISGIHTITSLSLLASAFWLSNIALLLGVIFLYKIILIAYDNKTAMVSVCLLATFPASLFYHVAYTESVTLLTTVLFFYFLQRDWWYSAMFSGFIATGVHDLGVVLAFPALLYLWNNKSVYSKRLVFIRVISISIIGFSLLGYMTFLYFRFGNPIAFVFAQGYWDRKAVIPVLNILVSIGLLFLKPYDWDFVVMCLVNGITTLAFAILGGMLIYDRKNKLLALDMKLFFLITLLLSIVSGTGYGTQSYARFMCVIFPGFIVMANVIKNKFVLIGILAVSLLVKLMLLGMFSNGYWVT
jgi:hypothetical protein